MLGREAPRISLSSGVIERLVRFAPAPMTADPEFGTPAEVRPALATYSEGLASCPVSDCQTLNVLVVEPFQFQQFEPEQFA